MMPLTQANEPANFDLSVRKPGLSFLAKTPNPTEAQWKKNAFWQRCLPDMRDSYNKICSYSLCWIPHATGSHSIDHFIAKAVDKKLAYEWNNYRYVSTRFNSRKGTKTIVDPFNMNFFWFTMDFATFFIKPDMHNLDKNQAALANSTIEILKLNDDDELVRERQSYFEDYKNKHIDIIYLRRKAPFLAYEMERQDLL